MARKFAYNLEKRRFAWAMELCEERLFIACYEQIKPKVRPNAGWNLDLDHHFYQAGTGVSEMNLAALNGERRRLGFDELNVQETEVFEYGRDTDRAMKAAKRSEMRDAFLDLNETARRAWIAEAQTEIAQLQPPHFFYDEFRERYARKDDGLTNGEMAKRRAALDLHVAPPPTDSLDPATALRLLKVVARSRAKEPGLEKIVNRITPEIALTLAEENADEVDPDVLQALIDRSMGLVEM